MHCQQEKEGRDRNTSNKAYYPHCNELQKKLSVATFLTKKTHTALDFNACNRKTCLPSQFASQILTDYASFYIFILSVHLWAAMVDCAFYAVKTWPAPPLLDQTLTATIFYKKRKKNSKQNKCIPVQSDTFQYHTVHLRRVKYSAF